MSVRPVYATTAATEAWRALGLRGCVENAVEEALARGAPLRARSGARRTLAVLDLDERVSVEIEETSSTLNPRRKVWLVRAVSRSTRPVAPPPRYEPHFTTIGEAATVRGPR